jgi:predicted lipase
LSNSPTIVSVRDYLQRIADMKKAPAKAKTAKTAKASPSTKQPSAKLQPEPYAYSMVDSARMLGCSKRKLWSLVAAKQITVFRIGKKKMVSKDELLRFIAEGGSTL